MSEHFIYKYYETKTLYELFVHDELPQYILDSCCKERIQFWVYPTPPKVSKVKSFARHKYIHGTPTANQYVTYNF